MEWIEILILWDICVIDSNASFEAQECRTTCMELEMLLGNRVVNNTLSKAYFEYYFYRDSTWKRHNSLISVHLDLTDHKNHKSLYYT